MEGGCKKAVLCAALRSAKCLASVSHCPPSEFCLAMFLMLQSTLFCCSVLWFALLFSLLSALCFCLCSSSLSCNSFSQAMDCWRMYLQLHNFFPCLSPCSAPFLPLFPFIAFPALIRLLFGFFEFSSVWCRAAPLLCNTPLSAS